MDDTTHNERFGGVGASDAGATRLGVLVVYYLRSDDDLPLLRLHLDRIRRHTAVPYTIYAVANRVSPEVRALLAAEPAVHLCDIAPTGDRGSREHGYYLDALLPIALADGMTHVCTFDVDSFPIDDAWFATAVDAGGPTGFAGVLRRENGDTELPHPSCTVMTRAFVEAHAPSFSPDLPSTPPFRRFQRSTGQAADTGVRIGAELWNSGTPWGRLVRSNAVDVHSLMAGVYADAVFHLGAAGRGKVFRTDVAASRTHRMTRPLERIPVPAKFARSRRRMVRRMRRGAEARIGARNREIYAVVRDWMYTDPDGLFAYLRGRSGADAEWSARLAPLASGSSS